MPIHTQIDREKDLTTHILTGKITQKELIEKTQSYYKQEIPTKFIIWEYQDSTLETPKAEDFQAGLNQSLEIQKIRQDGKTAVIASSEHIFRIYDTFDTLSLKQNIQFRLRAFRNKESALEWLFEKG